MTLARRLIRSLAGPALALCVLAAPAAACPYCALSQGADTLIYIMAFLGIPYVIVFGTWRWMKHVLAQEQVEQFEGANPTQPAHPTLTAPGGAAPADRTR